MERPIQLNPWYVHANTTHDIPGYIGSLHPVPIAPTPEFFNTNMSPNPQSPPRRPSGAGYISPPPPNASPFTGAEPVSQPQAGRAVYTLPFTEAKPVSQPQVGRRVYTSPFTEAKPVSQAQAGRAVYTPPFTAAEPVSQPQAGRGV